jgi:glycosyltransferase involved in cell wall biosynthesis
VNVVRVGVPEPLEDPWGQFRSAERVWTNLAAELPTHGIEVVTINPDVWLWDAYRELPDTDKPIVAILHEAPGDDEGLPQILVDHTDRIGRLIAERAERVVTCSSASRDRIAARYGIGFNQIDVAPYGVDLATFRPDGPTAGQAILNAGGDSRPYVLFVGTVMPRKNLPLLREAMVELPTHQLVVVASPCLHPDTQALLAAAVAPVGGHPVPNLAGIDMEGLAALMRGADLLCLPSLSEGFGLPVIEAMACGTPVVVSDGGSLPEVAGDAGVVVSPTRDGIVAGLRAALLQRSVLSEKAQRRAEQLTWGRTAEVVRRSLLAVVRDDAASWPTDGSLPGVAGMTVDHAMHGSGTANGVASPVCRSHACDYG